jgi:TolB-like protein
MNRSIILAAIIISTAILINGFLERRTHVLSTAVATTRPGITSANQTIAVLPFASISADEADKSFANGIQAEIITRLAKQHVNAVGVQEVPRSGVFLRGSVQRAANQIRINVQLVDAASGSPRWAESYDRQLTDVLAVESEIAENIAKSIAAQQKT